MKKVFGILAVMAVLWPFSCTPQSEGINVGGDGCDTVYIEGPEIGEFQRELARLREENRLFQNDLKEAETFIEEKDAIIADLTVTNATLNDQLQQCLNKPADTVYIDKIVEVMPKPIIDTVVVTHCADSTKNTTWFHHGGIDTPYPKDISFATKEFAFTRVTFNTPLTDSIKVQPSYKLRRTRDFENARTTFEFIE
jgi:hypothetical protein